MMSKWLSDLTVRPEDKVCLKLDPIKGRTLMARKPIGVGEIVAEYRMGMYPRETHVSATDNVYIFTVYDCNGVELPDLIGDVYEHSFYRPKCHLPPPWACFANEAAPGQDYNSEFICGQNDKRRRAAGRELVYALAATKSIDAGDEILVYYGPDYERDYPYAEPASPPKPKRKRRRKSSNPDQI
jgi:hypothetical protein